MNRFCIPWAVAAILPLLFSGCGSPFKGNTLAAMRIDGEPSRADWDRAVPLDLEVWMGNVNVRPEIVALDQETSHRSTAQCHHGTANTDPVKVRMQAFYNGADLHVRIRWADPTPDEELGVWEKRAEGWAARPAEDDGLAILWGAAADGENRGDFRCQKACHMMEVDVYDGGTQMRMGMKHGGGHGLDLWRWRAGITAPFGIADDMVVDQTGKRGDEGLELARTVPQPVEGGPVPYREVERPRGRQAHVSARSFWSEGWWELIMSRELDTRDPDDVVFQRGRPIPFSVSVFDSTRTEHHVLSGSVDLVLVEGGTQAARNRRIDDDPMDF